MGRVAVLSLFSAFVLSTSALPAHADSLSCAVGLNPASTAQTEGLAKKASSRVSSIRVAVSAGEKAAHAECRKAVKNRKAAVTKAAVDVTALEIEVGKKKVKRVVYDSKAVVDFCCVDPAPRS